MAIIAASSDAHKLGGRVAWTVLILVTLAQAMSMVDRQILAILVPRIKAALQVGDAEMGLLYGTVFALFYAIFSLPLGRLADGWVRTRLLAISVFGWSVMTALAGFANGFGLLAISRLGVGIGEASAQPAGMSVLSDSCPKERRGSGSDLRHGRAAPPFWQEQNRLRPPRPPLPSRARSPPGALGAEGCARHDAAQ